MRVQRAAAFPVTEKRLAIGNKNLEGDHVKSLSQSRSAMTRYLMIFMLLLVATGEAGAQSAEQEILEAARSACLDLDGGKFAVSDDAVIRVDLDGDDIEDVLVDEGKFACSTSASLFTPTGGAQLHSIVGGRHDVWMAQAWQLVDWGAHTILLLAEHGLQCGGLGYQPCFEAVVWSDDGPRTVARNQMGRP